MHYFSKSVSMGFEEAVAALRQALECHHLEILGEIDLSHALRRHLAVDCRPYLILSASSLRLAHRAIQANADLGALLLCNVVIQQLEEGHVEISAADPDDAIGTINHVDSMWAARQLRSLVQQAINGVEPAAESQRLLRHGEEPDRPLAHTLS